MHIKNKINFLTKKLEIILILNQHQIDKKQRITFLSVFIYLSIEHFYFILRFYNKKT
jgi:hypothetical protein